MKMFIRDKQQITIIVITAAIISGFVLFRYLPLRKASNAIKDAKSAQMLTITKGQAENKQLPVLKEQLAKLQQEVAKFGANIPMQRALGEFLQRIAEMMNEHNLKEQVVAPGEEIKVSELSCIPIEMHCSGGLAQIFEFYKRLQGLDRLVRIEQVKLESRQVGIGGEVSMHTKAVIYYRPQALKG